jgi:TolA-binding protein
MAQNAYYHIADCYLKTGNKQNALNALSLASKLDFDKNIQAEALFNYAKLSYEMAFNPYNEAITAFRKYIKDFPNARHVDEAYTYLANVFITTKSYREALDALESIKELTPDLKLAHQKVAYYRGVELFDNMEYEEAIKLFDKSNTYLFDRPIRANAIYWKAEALYRLNKYSDAIESYQRYIGEPGAIGKTELADANYNVGYAYFKQKDYVNSTLWFRKFVSFKPTANAKKINDAYNRIGDGYFVQRDFESAVTNYDNAYKMKLVDADYSLFQKAMANGVQKKYAEKISGMTALINTYPKSAYVQKAKFELAQTYYNNNQSDLALIQFKKFINDYPNSTFTNISLSKIALIYYSKQDDDNALNYFDQLIKRDRTSEEAVEAISTVKAIYASKGDPDGLQEKLKSWGANIPMGELDSLTFNNGKNHYMEQDCKSVVSDFGKYIQKFPEGFFITQANYYKAECEYKLGNTDAAFINYSYVISKPKGEFTENSLLKAADIAFKKKDYAKAKELYLMLESQAEDVNNRNTALIALMRSYYQLKEDENVIAYSNKVLKIENREQLLNEAHYNIAQTYLKQGKTDDAFAEFKALANSTKAEIGTEAKYNVAEILYTKKDYLQSKKEIFELINREGDYPFWVTKAMILLSDDYVALKDNLNAKAGLKGIIEDSDIPELIKVAQEKLDKINADEEAEKLRKMNPAPPVELEFKDGGDQQKELFKEDATNTPTVNQEEGKHE